MDLPVAEVGVAEGRFSEEILSWGVSKLYLIDAWKTLNTKGDGASPQSWHTKNYEEVLERIEPFKKDVTILIGLSTEMAKYIPDESLGMVYLDAGHDYKNVLADLKAYYPKVVKGGIIAGHDYLCKDYEVEKAVKDFVDSKFSINIIPENHINDAGFWFIKQ